MKITLKALLLVLVFGTLAGCKKYEEDNNLLTLRSVKNRLTNGKWQLTEFDVSGEDSTEYYNDIEFNYTFTKDDANTSIGYDDRSLYSFRHNFTYLGDKTTINGSVYFYEDGNYVRFLNNEYYDIYYYPYDIYYPSIFNSYDEDNSPYWKIIKLTNDHFWLTTTYNNGEEYTMKLTKSK
jgi:hypothetical protein